MHLVTGTIQLKLPTLSQNLFSVIALQENKYGRTDG